MKFWPKSVQFWLKLIEFRPKFSAVAQPSGAFPGKAAVPERRFPEVAPFTPVGR